MLFLFFYAFAVSAAVLLNKVCTFHVIQGMHAGLPKYVPVNLKDIESAGFQEGEEVSLESLKKKGLLNPSGRERKLPLKVMMVLNTSSWNGNIS